jgi:hypothetical protein
LNAQPKMKPKSQDQDSIAEAVAQLREHEAKIATESKKLGVVSAAIDKARNVVNEHASAARRVAELREERRKLLADSLIGADVQKAMTKVDQDLKAAEVRSRDLAPLAEDATAAIAELEARYAVAQAPLIVLSKETPRLRAQVLEQAAKPLLDELGTRACDFFDVYLECVALANQFNQIAKHAGLPQVHPDSPQPFDFPGVTLWGYQIENRGMVANPQQLEAARARLVKKLADLVVEV